MSKARARKQLEARDRARRHRQDLDRQADSRTHQAAIRSPVGPAAGVDAKVVAPAAGDDMTVNRGQPVLVQLVHNKGDRATELMCPWCHTVFPVKPRGRVPTWCSAACRQRAWEQARAAASGRSAVTVVEPRTKQVVFSPWGPPQPAPPQPDISPPTPQGWADQIQRLSAAIDAGLVYDRDLYVIAPALTAVVTAYNRHVGQPAG